MPEEIFFYILIIFLEILSLKDMVTQARTRGGSGIVVSWRERRV